MNYERGSLANLKRFGLIESAGSFLGVRCLILSHLVAARQVAANMFATVVLPHGSARITAVDVGTSGIVFLRIARPRHLTISERALDHYGRLR